jgi:site-specific recombinase XerD
VQKSLIQKWVGHHYDRQIDEKAYQYRRNIAFLGHTWNPNISIQSSDFLRRNVLPKTLPSHEPEFDDSYFEALLFRGFKVRGQYDYRNMLITLLLHGGGLRVSEAFHLYISDVQPHWENPNIAFVCVHHPSLGLAPNNWLDPITGKNGSRQRYLAHEFGLSPRSSVLDRTEAGWKEPMLDRKWYMQVWWLPPEYYGHIFMSIWKCYMEQIANITRSHPYAFINTHRNPGDIYTMKSYFKAYYAAIERIGLIPSKKNGTTPHGGRHAYGRRAARANIHTRIIQRMMHHCSPNSQEVYTRPQNAEINNALKIAIVKLEENTLYNFTENFVKKV